MLGKIQEISTKLDKKRVYTAIGALFVALAAGHVMQRNVGGQPDTANVVPPQPVTTQQAMIQPPAQPTVPEAPAERTSAEVSQPNDTVSPTPVPEADDPVDLAEAAPVVDDLAPLDTDAPIGNVSSRSEGYAHDGFLTADPDEPGVSEARATPDALTGSTDTASLSRNATVMELPMPGAEEDLVDIDPPEATVTTAAPQTDGALQNCTPRLSAQAMPEAMIKLTMVAACDAGETVTFDHMGLRFTETLDDNGELSVVAPALSGEAMIRADLHGKTFERRLDVPNMARFERVALVWQGGTGLQLHALENGSFYGDPGHIWAEHPETPSRASTGAGGYLTVLGSTAGGFAADVYTAPVAMAVAPAVSVEAQVLDSTCGTAVSGTLLRSVERGKPTATEVGMYLPDCDAVGEYLVLKNLPRDLTIARN